MVFRFFIILFFAFFFNVVFAMTLATRMIEFLYQRFGFVVVARG